MERALDTQVGGDHYKKLKIQPVEYIVANNIGYLEGNVIKYVTRWRDKGGVRDLEKAKHYIDMLMELQNQKAKAGMLELVQEELEKAKAEDTPMLAETIGIDSEELLEHGQTKPEAIKNLLKTYKRVIVRYNANTSDKEIQNVADNLRGLSIDITREPPSMHTFGVVVHYVRRGDRGDE